MKHPFRCYDLNCDCHIGKEQAYEDYAANRAGGRYTVDAENNAADREARW